MSDQFSRTQMLIGEENVKKLKNMRVAVFGIGGVGGYVVEALVRSGLGNIDLVDDDKISISNLNRQIIALNSTIGKYKVDVAYERIMDINPDVKVTKNKLFYTSQTADEFDFSKYDYIVDAIDTVSGKISIAVEGQRYKVPVISSMGTGNKLSPQDFKVADIYETSVCPLARVMRHELKKRGVRSLKVVYSKEKPVKINYDVQSEIETSETEAQKEGFNKKVPASIAFVPAAAGLIIASEVIKDLILV